MKIQFNTDASVDGDDDLARRSEAIIDGGHSRFAEQITRVEAHLTDVDGPKHGTDDKRCLLEARLAGLQPLAVSHQAGSLDEAVTGATKKRARAIESRLGRLSDR